MTRTARYPMDHPAQAASRQGYEATPMLLMWSIALIVAFIVTMALAAIITLDNQMIALTLTAASALIKGGLSLLLRH